ncbi:MAG: patatin-like phospholipase family protein [Ectothiorhodospiraceae bacterium]
MNPLRKQRGTRPGLPRVFRRRTVPLLLALQGGGAHGAFTWGILDRLLEERWLRVAGLSGASAGAMNAVVAASGWVEDRHEGARYALHEFWRRVSSSAGLGGFQPGVASAWSSGLLMLRALTRVASPYQFNPMGMNPLGNILRASVDFDALRHSQAPQLLVSAANVHTGRLRLFDNTSINEQALEASACLPLLFHAVEIGGEHYWDGGYAANPPLLPLARLCPRGDLILVQLNPVRRDDYPRTASDIAARINEIGFNAGQLRELETLAQLPRRSGLLGRLAGLPQVRWHRIDTNGALADKDESSSMNTDWTHLTQLRDLGRDRAAQWLEHNGTALGRRATLDLEQMRPVTGG